MVGSTSVSRECAVELVHPLVVAALHVLDDGQGIPAHVIASSVRYDRDRGCGVVEDSVDDRAEMGADGRAADPPADDDQ